MRYCLAFFYGEDATGKDELGNDIMEPNLLAEALSRRSEWSGEDVDLHGREVTSTTLKLVTRAGLGLVEASRKVRFKGDEYCIVKVIGTDDDRWRTLFLECMK